MDIKSCVREFHGLMTRDEKKMFRLFNINPMPFLFTFEENLNGIFKIMYVSKFSCIQPFGANYRVTCDMSQHSRLLENIS